MTQEIEATCESIKTIQGLSNDLCNHIDNAMMTVVPALCDFPCRSEFHGVGKLQEAFEFASKARQALTEAGKTLGDSKIIIEAFEKRGKAF
jgi:hypothetical protein